MDNSVGIDCESGVWDGQRMPKGKIWDKCNRNNKKITPPKQKCSSGPRHDI